jgi:hypothetical protein
MSDLSPLSGEERNSNLGAAKSVDNPGHFAVVSRRRGFGIRTSEFVLTGTSALQNHPGGQHGERPMRQVRDASGRPHWRTLVWPPHELTMICLSNHHQGGNQ